MPDFPSAIWLREPVIDGRLRTGGGLNRAMELLSQARDEVEAIEAALGTNPSGSHPDLKTRFAERISGSGLRRAQVYAARGPNPTPPNHTQISGWREGGSLWLQFGVDYGFTSSPQTITFPKAYFTGNAPVYIVATPITGTGTGTRAIDVQARYDNITTTTFRLAWRHFDNAGAWVTPNGDFTFGASWVAVGGFPST